MEKSKNQLCVLVTVGNENIRDVNAGMKLWVLVAKKRASS